MQLAEDPHTLEEIVEESKFVENRKILSTVDEIVKHEPILMAVKDRLYGGVFSSLDTNGNIREFCCELKNILIEKYGVKFIFNQEIKDFIVENTTDSFFYLEPRHITAVLTSDNQRIDNIDNIILTNGNHVMPLLKKLHLYVPVYPVKVKA